MQWRTHLPFERQDQPLALDELGQDAACHGRVDEDLSLYRVARARVTDEADALVAKLSEGFLEIIDPHGDEVDSFALLGEPLGDGALVARCRDEFEVGAVKAEEGHSHTGGRRLRAVGDVRPVDGLVAANGGVEVFHGDDDVVDSLEHDVNPRSNVTEAYALEASKATRAAGARAA